MLKGSHHSEKTRKQQSETRKKSLAEGKIIHPMLNKPHSEIHKKNISLGMKGRHVSYETRRKISLSESGKYVSLKTREKISGEKNPAWLGGKSFEPYTPDFNKRFKKSIKERDGICMLCNISFDDLHLLGRKVSVHHIDYDKLNSMPQNCVSLCSKCHGTTVINRPHWVKFFQSLLKERYNYEYTEDQKIILDFTKPEV